MEKYSPRFNNSHQVGARHLVGVFTHVISFNSHHNPGRLTALSFFRGKSWISHSWIWWNLVVMTAFHFCPPPDLPFLFLFLSICLPFLSLSPAFPSSSLAVDHLTHTLSPSLSSSLSLTRNWLHCLFPPLFYNPCYKVHILDKQAKEFKLCSICWIFWHLRLNGKSTCKLSQIRFI